MIDGRLVVGYLRLAAQGNTADRDAEAQDLLARLRELVLPRVGEAALAVVDDERCAPDALATVARALEEAGRDDPTFARAVIRLCDEIARQGVRPAPWPEATVRCPRCGRVNRADYAFCDHCGTFLQWECRAQPAPPYPPDAEPPQAPPRPYAPKGRIGVTLDPSARLELGGSTESSQRAQAMIDRALSAYVQRGRLLFDPPEQMRQGRTERVRVAIAQHGGLEAQLRALAAGRADAAIHDVETTPFMEVDLQGSAFSIVSLQAGSSAEQLLRPTALWQFDVTPERRGTHLLQLRVAMRIPLADREERVSLPALERTIRVRVDAAYGGRRFVREHWQWVAATLAGLGGAIGAWIKIFQP